jgi:hypothetical protein
MGIWRVETVCNGAAEIEQMLYYFALNLGKTYNPSHMRKYARKHKLGLVRLVSGLAMLATLGLAQLFSAYAAGVLFVALTGNDANTCLTMASACSTIPSAVSKASSGDTIIIAAGTYVGGFGIDKNLTLIGFGADATIVDQGTIVVTYASVRIYDLAIMHGNSDAGGGLYNDRGNVTLGRVAILNNLARSGGGIYNSGGTLLLDHTLGIVNVGGSLLLTHSIVRNNRGCGTGCFIPLSQAPSSPTPHSNGGGIFNDGAMTIDASAIISNSSANGGDGIYNNSTLVISNSTISNNTGFGFGIYNASALTLTNVTLNSNLLNLVNAGDARLHNTFVASFCRETYL